MAHTNWQGLYWLGIDVTWENVWLNSCATWICSNLSLKVRTLWRYEDKEWIEVQVAQNVVDNISVLVQAHLFRKIKQVTEVFFPSTAWSIKNIVNTLRDEIIKEGTARREKGRIVRGRRLAVNLNRVSSSWGSWDWCRAEFDAALLESKLLKTHGIVLYVIYRFWNSYPTLSEHEDANAHI